MKLSKRKRKLLYEHEKSVEINKNKLEARQTIFWNKVQAHIEESKNAIESDEFFEEIISEFAKLYNAKKIINFQNKYQDVPKLTSTIITNWLNISDYEERDKEIKNWICLAQKQKKEYEYNMELEFQKLHPYRIPRKIPIFPIDMIMLPLGLEVLGVTDITNGEGISLNNLKEYNAKHHPHIDIDKEIEWLKNSNDPKKYWDRY